MVSWPKYGIPAQALNKGRCSSCSKKLGKNPPDHCPRCGVTLVIPVAKFDFYRWLERASDHYLLFSGDRCGKCHSKVINNLCLRCNLHYNELGISESP